MREERKDEGRGEGKKEEGKNDCRENGSTVRKRKIKLYVYSTLRFKQMQLYFSV